MSVAERFGANLVCCREAAGLSQEDLGFRAGLHRTQISYMERGLTTPRIDTLAKLAGALGIVPEKLMAGIDWRPWELRPGRFTD